MPSIEFVTSQFSKIFWLEASSRPQEEQDRYHIYGVFEYTIPPNLIRLNDSLQAIVNTHYNLRSTFKEHADDLIQVVHHNVFVKLDSYVVHSNDKCNALIRRIIELPFDLINGPLFRFTCIQNMVTNSTLFIPNFHHIIIDGTQFDKLMETISHHYHYTSNLVQHDQDCVAQLQAYIIWEAEQIKRADLQYWIKKAENYPLEIDLPYKHSLVDKRKTKENAALYQLDNELYDRVQEFSSKLGCSIFDIFKTVWALLICQYSNQTKIVITYPVNTRRKGFKSVKGAFLNACLFFFEVRGSFRSCISDQKKERRDMHNRYISIIEILSRLEKASFKCAISQADLAIIGPSLESKPGYRFKIGLGSTDLCMFLNTMGPSLQFGLVAAQNLFDNSMLDRLSKNFAKLLSRIVDNPDMDLAVLSCLTKDEYDLVVNQWNKTIVPYPQAAISRLFEEQVFKNPYKTAILYQNHEFSYQEINEKANQLARYIRHEYLMTTKNQLVGDVLIPICMGRGVEFIIALLAILKAGAAYVPIDPKHPKRRIQRLLDDINAPLMLTEHQLIIKIRSMRPKMKLIWQDKNILEKEDVNNLENMVVPSQLAYVIYTSGTTGQPKGVMIQHNSVVSLVKGVTYFNASERDTFAFFSDVAFDAATFELWGALLNGSRLFIPDNHLQIILDSSLFKKCLDQNNITVLWLTKTVFDLLFSSDKTLFSTLNYLLVGGESLNKDYMQSLLNSPYKPKHIINGYGPTENTTFSCTYDINQAISQLSSVPIGKPLSNRICYVLDKNLKPQPIGVVGELYVGGAGLARGYLNKEELNRERFIKNPFSKDQDGLFSRLYKTEDYVKWLPNGDLEYIARQDSQIKLRGYRIELQEIESQLLIYPGIKQSLILLKDMGGDKYLIAYYVSDYQLDEEAIRSFMCSGSDLM
jgi:amino acid adenylation domain-containing protein